MKIDYQHYRFSPGELLRYGVQGAGICLLVNYLCYQTLWVFLLMLPIPILFMKWKKKMLIQKRRSQLGYQFKDALHSLSVALNTGYSMENAIGECVRDLRNIYESQSPILLEFAFIQSQLKVSVPVEKLLLDLGRRSQIEDIQNFASIYAIAKRSGGNLKKILQKTARMTEEKITVRQEIAASVAARKMDQSVMSIVPCGIILYMHMTSPGFLDGLYGNPAGAAVMTVCLFIYLSAYRMGRKIVEIEV